MAGSSRLGKDGPAPDDAPDASPRIADIRAVRGDTSPGVDPGGSTGGRGARSRSPRLTEPDTMREDDDGLGDGLPPTIDRVAAFRPAILAIRWGTTIVSLALAAQSFPDIDSGVAFWAGVLVVYTLLRTLVPIRYRDDGRSLLEVYLEVVIFILGVSLTGYWESPFAFSLLTAISVAGFARGFGFGIRVGTVAALGVSILYLAPPETGSDEFRISAQWAVSLVLVGLVAGYARRISGEADRQHSLALDRLGRLADANALLFSLHRVTQTLPASLEMGDVTDTTLGRLKGLFDFDAAAILLLEESDMSWEVLLKEGVRLGARVGPAELPPPLELAFAEQTALMVNNLEGGEGPGLAGRSGSGLYATLHARGSIIGLLAVEARTTNAFGPRDLELFRGFIEPVALAIDNARWFTRLRTVGADEERTRIARDLHDRIGQSLAYLAFEVDRLVGKADVPDTTLADLEQLRTDIRGVIGEVRDTLYDLRTDVSDHEGIGEVLEQFVGRLRNRSNLDIDLIAERRNRLPILQEREMWRIAQEALTNIERHSEATRVEIAWRCDGQNAHLEVADNGAGFPTTTAGRLDSYGIMGMRERAASIGATLELVSAEGEGTTVRCQLRSAG